jgi:hypothetical protein
VDDDLSERARRLVEVAMAQDVPPDGVADDCWGRVVSRVRAETERSSAVPRTATAANARPRALRLLGLLAIVATIGAGTWLALRPTPTVEPAPQAPAPVVVSTAGAAPRDRALEATPSAPATERLLDDAEAALATAPGRALDLVGRHAALAPQRDAERRMALRIDILCALGRKEEARAETLAFFAVPRGEEWSARVRASCGAPAAGAQ